MAAGNDIVIVLSMDATLLTWLSVVVIGDPDEGCSWVRLVLFEYATRYS